MVWGLVVPFKVRGGWSGAGVGWLLRVRCFVRFGLFFLPAGDGGCGGWRRRPALASVARGCFLGALLRFRGCIVFRVP